MTNKRITKNMLDQALQNEIATPPNASPVGHTHDESDIVNIDKYTKAETNQLLSTKSDTTHTHFEYIVDAPVNNK